MVVLLLVVVLLTAVEAHACIPRGRPCLLVLRRLRWRALLRLVLPWRARRRRVLARPRRRRRILTLRRRAAGATGRAARVGHGGGGGRQDASRGALSRVRPSRDAEGRLRNFQLCLAAQNRDVAACDNRRPSRVSVSAPRRILEPAVGRLPQRSPSSLSSRARALFPIEPRRASNTRTFRGADIDRAGAVTRPAPWKLGSKAGPSTRPTKTTRASVPGAREVVACCLSPHVAGLTDGRTSARDHVGRAAERTPAARRRSARGFDRATLSPVALGARSDVGSPEPTAALSLRATANAVPS